MNREAQLKVQAWLDGELGRGDVAEVSRLVREDPVSAGLARELKLTRQWLAAGEPVRPLPQTREHYWDGIARQLTPHGQPGTTTRALADWGIWLRWLIPAAAAIVLLAVLFTPPADAPRSAGISPAEVDTPLDDLGSFTFRSDSEQMTVVWVDSD
jgi:hypothetical protein